MEMIDISVALNDRLPLFPGDPAYERAYENNIDRMGKPVVSRLSMSSHMGTHVDAPNHFYPDGNGTDDIELSDLIGPVWILEYEGNRDIPADWLAERVGPIGPIERILFKTRNSALWKEQGFQSSYIGISLSAAKVLTDLGVKVVGIDYLSVDGPGKHVMDSHMVFLEAGIIILEGLDLSKTVGGWHDLICLPIKISGGDGAPARAVVIQR